MQQFSLRDNVFEKIYNIVSLYSANLIFAFFWEAQQVYFNKKSIDYYFRYQVVFWNSIFFFRNMAVLTDNELKKLTDQLSEITDEQAQFSYIGGESDAEDNLVIPRHRKSSRQQNKNGALGDLNSQSSDFEPPPDVFQIQNSPRK